MWLLLIFIVVWPCHIFFIHFPVDWHLDCFLFFFFFAFTDHVAMNSFLQCPCACLSLGVFLQDSDTQRSVVWGLGNYVLQIGNLWQNVNQLSLLIYLMFLILVRLSQWSKKCSFLLEGWWQTVCSCATLQLGTALEYVPLEQECWVEGDVPLEPH